MGDLGDFLGEMRMAKVDMLGRGECYQYNLEREGRTVSVYCSACAFRVGLSTKQATGPYSDKGITLRRALRPIALLVGFPSENPPKIGTITAWNRTRNRARAPPAFVGDRKGSTKKLCDKDLGRTFG